MWTMSWCYPVLRIDDNWREGSVTVSYKSMVWTYSYNIHFQAGLTKQVVKKIYFSYLFEGIGIFDREHSSGWFKYSPSCELIVVCVCCCVLRIQLSDFAAWLNLLLKISKNKYQYRLGDANRYITKTLFKIYSAIRGYSTFLILVFHSI